MKRIKGFTLIELLIVVAIIAILAAIAVPNFLEAQVRSKVSRVKADQRSLATGLEAYYVDNNDFPAYAVGASGANGFA
ncbi:prepilin-type N-terminal cleavage/methylation domain-containing protein, partial [Candidatus Sumerlaeota bacterium]|nr:prepilin-type N-terminal cleavage/methylation domain-containing protein [Candidatus Sumerlaeota bacterium]